MSVVGVAIEYYEAVVDGIVELLHLEVAADRKQVAVNSQSLGYFAMGVAEQLEAFLDAL